jgi:Tol biopolymer transport system component
MRDAPTMRSTKRALIPALVLLTTLAGGSAAHSRPDSGGATDPLWCCISPDWSPDGTRIAFVGGSRALHPDYLEAYVADADGSNAREILAGADPVPNVRSRAAPRWSRDGRRLAFVSLWRDCYNCPTGPQGYLTRVVEADGTGLRRVGSGVGSEWSPDGRFLLLQLGHPRGAVLGLERVDVASGAARRIASGRVGDARWSPDGKRIIFVDKDWIWIMRADGSSKRRLVWGQRPTWSPDGRRIAYWSPTHLYVVGADGRGRRLLFRAPPRHGAASAPEWSPDGSRIAGVHFGLAASKFRSFVTVVNASSGRARRVLEIRSSEGSADADSLGDLDWSPDGSRLAIGSLRGLRIVGADGRSPRVVAPLAGR